VPIILETMSAAPEPWGLLDLTGTPKGYDNPIQKAWELSSQAEWVIKCREAGCGHWNFCSTEIDLFKMLGPAHRGIGPVEEGGVPGTVCAKCQKPVDPDTGTWLHAVEDRRWTYQGYHVPQCILPMHYASAQRWATLIGKSQTLSPNVFANECLGASCDTGSKLISLQELRAACVLPIRNNQKKISREVFANRDDYRNVAIGIDWGGGGGDGIFSNTEQARRRRISFTSIACIGQRHVDGKLDVLWGTRLLTPNDHALEAAQILEIVKQIRPNIVAHDVTGAGALRETLLIQAGLSSRGIMGIDYKHVPTGMPIQHVPEVPGDHRQFWRIDKTRTLLATINAIKFGAVRLFEYDQVSEDDPGVIADFLALTEEKVETQVGDRYIIRRLTAFSDDFAHAVNFACVALWHSSRSWPDFIKQARLSPGSVAGQLDGGSWT
jgi:hypothetical protein